MDKKAVFYNADMDTIYTPYVCYVDAGIEIIAGLIAKGVANGELEVPVYVEVQELGTANTVSLWEVEVTSVNRYSQLATERYSTDDYAMASSGPRRYTSHGQPNTCVRMRRV